MSPRASARAYDNIMAKYFEDAFLPMLGLYMRLFYSLNKLRSWFCISNVEDTKTEHFTSAAGKNKQKKKKKKKKTINTGNKSFKDCSISQIR